VSPLDCNDLLRHWLLQLNVKSRCATPLTTAICSADHSGQTTKPVSTLYFHCERSSVQALAKYDSPEMPFSTEFVYKENMWFSLVLLCLAASADARVSFAKSEVLDNVDLQGTNKAAFRCSAGCRIFSPTKTDMIVVVDGAGNKVASLRMLAEMNSAVEMFDLPGGSYQLKNVGPTNPSFVFYAVEKDAANFNTKVFYPGNNQKAFEANQNYTFLSASGAVSFHSFDGFTPVDSTPVVYAAGFDAVDGCRPVFTTRTLVALDYTEFTVNSPIATVTFKKPAVGRPWIYVSGELITPNQLSEQDSGAVYTTPGYVGCPSVGDSLYSFIPAVTTIDADSTLERSAGLRLSITGDYSIANQADSLAITVNNDVTKLFGKGSISKTYDDTKFDVKLSWKKNVKAKDAFAVQFDMESTGRPY
ncbi:hypothetical protein PMAYCL1PPCAC_00029, partial [Pristionchus mayeri]